MTLSINDTNGDEVEVVSVFAGVDGGDVPVKTFGLGNQDFETYMNESAKMHLDNGDITLYNDNIGDDRLGTEYTGDAEDFGVRDVLYTVVSGIDGGGITQENVAMSGDTMVFGDQYDASAFDDAGKAYVYIQSGDGWVEQETFTGAEQGESLGYSIDIDGDTLVIGAIFGGSGSAGSALVYTRSGTTWSLQQTLTGSTTATDFFGACVSVSGDTIVVGANQHSSARGKIYIFTRSGTTWSLQDSILGENTGDNFGNNLGMDGDILAVGAFNEDGQGNASGKGYIYTRSGTTWTEEFTLEGEEAFDRLGFRAQVSGNTAVFASFFGGDAEEGEVHIYTRSGTTWTEEELLLGDNVSDYYGQDVDINGDTLAVGARRFGDNREGRLHIYTRSGTTWTEVAVYDGVTESVFGFGEGVAVDSENVIIRSRDALHMRRWIRSGLTFLKSDFSGLEFDGEDLFGTEDKIIFSSEVTLGTGDEQVVIPADTGIKLRNISASYFQIDADDLTVGDDADGQSYNQEVTFNEVDDISIPSATSIRNVHPNLKDSNTFILELSDGVVADVDSTVYSTLSEGDEIIFDTIE